MILGPFFEQEDDCYKSITVGNFWHSNYIEYESNSDRNKNLSLKEYLDKIKPYLSDIIIDLQNSDTTFAINICNLNISSKDVEQECVMHSTSNNIEFMPYDNPNGVVDEVFKSLLSRYKNNLETSMRGSDFIFNSDQHMYYKCQRINFRRGGSYIESPDWIKNKKSTINPKDKDDTCFQYAVTVALNYGKIKWNPEIVSNIKPLIHKCN